MNYHANAARDAVIAMLLGRKGNYGRYRVDIFPARGYCVSGRDGAWCLMVEPDGYLIAWVRVTDADERHALTALNSLAGIEVVVNPDYAEQVIALGPLGVAALRAALTTTGVAE